MSKKTAMIMVDYPIPDTYYAEDTEWIVDPDEIHDPGVLAAKPGTVPVNMKKKDK